MIYTLYSYKGGVGRSMALANLAELFYRAGLRVLMVDWDLEAPGLERYFFKPGADPSNPHGRSLEDVMDSPGLLDLLTEYRDTLARSPRLRLELAENDTDPADGAPKNVRSPRLRRIMPDYDDLLVGTEEPVADPELKKVRPPTATPEAVKHHVFERLIPGGVRRFIVDIEGRADQPAWLGLLHAGRREGDHFWGFGEKLQDFSWGDFYRNLSGAQFIEWFRHQVEGIADVVLVDSRTGATETGGTCIHHLADAVVMLCAPNAQNLEGCRRIADDIRRAKDRGRLKRIRGDRPIEILTIPSRVEDRAETAVADSFAKEFAKLSSRDPLASARSVWDFGIPYVPYYGFFEKVAVRDNVDAPGRANLVAAYIRLLQAIVDMGPGTPPRTGTGIGTPDGPPDAETEQEVRLLIHAAPEDGLWADLLADVLSAFDTIKSNDQTLSRQTERLFSPARVYRGFRELIDGETGTPRNPFRAIAQVRDRKVVTHVLVLLSENYFRRFEQWDPLTWAFDLPLSRLVEGDGTESRRVYPIFVGDPVQTPNFSRRFWASGTEWQGPADAVQTAVRILSWFRQLGAAEVKNIELFARPSAVTRETPHHDTIEITKSYHITNTRGMPADKIRAKLSDVKEKLGWEGTTGSARKWWETFESDNPNRVDLVLRLAEELHYRSATITEFFLAYVYSNTDNIQANLHYLDYTRLKKAEEGKAKP